MYHPGFRPNEEKFNEHIDSVELIDSSYVRADVPLNVWMAMCKSFTDPIAGVLEISTEDGVLRLAINGDAAKT